MFRMCLVFLGFGLFMAGALIQTDETVSHTVKAIMAAGVPIGLTVSLISFIWEA